MNKKEEYEEARNEINEGRERAGSLTQKIGRKADTFAFLIFVFLYRFYFIVFSFN